MSRTVTVRLPSVLAIDVRIGGNWVRQVAAPDESHVVTVVKRSEELWSMTGVSLETEVFVGPKRSTIPRGVTHAVKAAIGPTDAKIDLSKGTWIVHPTTKRHDPISWEHEIQMVQDSWRGAFAYSAEDDTGLQIGLRPPQIGAVHAVHAHWSVTNETATIVMPTGTGKTETMLALLVSANDGKLIVVVPTDALREQLSRKFMCLGILKHKNSAILKDSAKFPIVGTVRHVPSSTDEVEKLLSCCQVVVLTSKIAGQISPPVRSRLADFCEHLFIDEAHHAEARTWREFRQAFEAKKVLQFTATPFREDGRPIDGKIIYRYPLRKAQHDGYFQPIRFRPIRYFDQKRADQAIAMQAIAQLRDDEGKRHIAMARVDSITRAEEVLKIYQRECPEYRPIALHSRMRSADRDEAKARLLEGSSRLVVCVDMLGEGFDLPELKIAAFHDIRKSIAVTLQLAGRFTRTKAGLGNATFIANTANPDVREELRRLYAQDPDWDDLLPRLSDELIDKEAKFSEFVDGFTPFAEDLPLKTLRPATSAVVYKASCADWTPENFSEGLPRRRGIERTYSSTNLARNTLVVATLHREALPWSDAETLFDWKWELYVLVWMADLKLLFVNSSTNAGTYRALARAVIGDDAQLISGTDIFRIFGEVKRLRLQNVGLTEHVGRNVRYTGRMGADVDTALSDIQRRHATKSVLSGSGFEDGERTTIGASRRGRIWAFKKERLDGFVRWCRQVGSKLLDQSINPESALRGTLLEKPVHTRPILMPLAVDWPEEFYESDTLSTWTLRVNGYEIQFADVELDLIEPTESGPLRIAVSSPDVRVPVELVLNGNPDNPDYLFRLARRGDQVTLVRGARGRELPLEDYFREFPPPIWFADGSSLEGCFHVQPPRQVAAFDAQKIESWDWSGIDIRAESQGKERRKDSIQAKVIAELTQRRYDLIFDDDDAGEVADVIGVRLEKEEEEVRAVNVDLFHCKFSGEANPGARVNDLYEACGQAQKSINWLSSPYRYRELFTRLLQREEYRLSRGGPSRIQVGSDRVIELARNASLLARTAGTVRVVQPGLSKRAVSQQQLLLLGVTSNYLWETYQIPFGVISSL